MPVTVVGLFVQELLQVCHRCGTIRLRVASCLSLMWDSLSESGFITTAGSSRQIDLRSFFKKKTSRIRRHICCVVVYVPGNESRFCLDPGQHSRRTNGKEKKSHVIEAR